MTTLTVIDYGRGNLLSLSRALEHCGAQVEIVEDPEGVRQADKLLLPGVGAFGDAAEALARQNLTDAIVEYAATQRPFLGICVGMQLLFDRSEEFGDHPGLGLISGDVAAIPKTTVDGGPLKVPHIGWSATAANTAEGGWNGTLLEGLSDPSWFYFVHSFAVRPAEESAVIGACRHGGHSITAVVNRGAIWGCQFHPEKSGEAGLAVLRNFVAL